MKENKGEVEVVNFDEAKKDIQKGRWQIFFRSPAGKDYMRLLENRVERINDPEVPSVYKINESQRK